MLEDSELAGDAVHPATRELADVRARPTSPPMPQSATLDDIATIIYTSGTTGPPKGVMLSHRNVAWTLESVGQSMREQTDIDDFAGKRHVSYLPMAHIFERLLGHYYLLDFATQVVCCPETIAAHRVHRRGPAQPLHRRPTGVGEAVRRASTPPSAPTRTRPRRSTKRSRRRCRSSRR